MTLLSELERLGRAVAATGAGGDIAVVLPRVAFFTLVRELEAQRPFLPRAPERHFEVYVTAPAGAVRVTMGGE